MKISVAVAALNRLMAPDSVKTRASSPIISPKKSSRFPTMALRIAGEESGDQRRNGGDGQSGTHPGVYLADEGILGNGELVGGAGVVHIELIHRLVLLL